MHLRGIRFACLWVVIGVAALRTAAAATTIIDNAAIYPEAPLWIDGKLLYVEYAGPGIKLWTGGRTQLYWRKEHCGPSGLIAFADHHLLVACYDSNSIVELDAAGKELRVIAKDSAGNPFTGPNDFAPDGAGGIYVSASGVFDFAAPITGTILHLAADGGRLVEVANTIHYPNGLTVSQDGTQLLVAEMLAARILSFAILPGGRLGERRVWARLQDIAPPTPHTDAYNGPDGFKLGPDGNYYIAQNGSGRVLVVDANKHLVRSIDVEAPYVTNMNFGPDGARIVFITAVFDPWKAPYPGVVYRWIK